MASDNDYPVHGRTLNKQLGKYYYVYLTGNRVVEKKLKITEEKF